MKTVSDLCREALELREKSPFVPKENWSFDDDSRTVDCSECGTEVDVSGFIVKSSDEHQAVDIHLYGMEKICKPQAEFIVFAANHIKTIAERCLELEKEVEGYRSGNLPTWKSEYDLIKSVCDEVDKNNEELRAENIRLRALVANPNLEEWYLKSENLRMVCIRLARAKTIEKRDQVASKCKHLFSDVKDILRGDEALKGGQGG